MTVRVAIDAMGGDTAPQPVLEALPCLAEMAEAEIVLVGRPEILEPAAQPYSNVSVYPAQEVIGMDESASVAIKKKPDSSIAVAIGLAKHKKVDAVVSAGHSGATMACSVMGLGRLPGVTRPAITTLLPTGDNPIIVLDVGANVDCKSEMMVDFAIMGSVYARRVLNRETPRVALLSIGTEKSKGNEMTLGAYPLLEQAPIEFVGNVEGKHIFGGTFDVLVCDGFVGNVLLKFGEATAIHIYELLKQQVAVILREHPDYAQLLKESFNMMFRGMDHEEFGGAPLLGINGNCVICHGEATARAICNGVQQAIQSVNHNVNGHILNRLKEVHDPTTSNT